MKHHIEKRPTKQLVIPNHGKRPTYGTVAEFRRAILLVRCALSNVPRNIQNKIHHDKPHTYFECGD